MSTTIALRAFRHLLRPVGPKEMGGLFSFHYFRAANMGTFLKVLQRNGYTPEVFTDSGGFSAFSQGATVDLDEYVRWLLRWRGAIDHYANLDVIGDPRTSLRNLLRMEQKGLRPLPVLHVGTDPEEVRRYRARGYDYQCLGGMVPHLSAMATSILRGDGSYEPLAWVRRCHEVAAEEGVRLHGFGATNLPVVQAFPWRSVDSSSWARGFRFGNATIFDPLSGRWLPVSLRDTQKIMRLRFLLAFYGVDALSLVKDARDSRITMITLAARSYLAATRWVREKRPEGQPLQLYLADSVSGAKDAIIYAQAFTQAPDWVG